MAMHCLEVCGCRGKRVGWLRHILTFLSIILMITGAFLLIYITWVLATSVTLIHFVSGRLVFTYSVLGLGLLLFLTGLFGWVACTSEKICLLRFYFVLLLLAIFLQVGGIIAINVIGIQMTEILKKGWGEVNQSTQSLVQTKLDCCGFEGPQDFTTSSIQIDSSCYAPADETELFPEERLKENGCGSRLHTWFEANKIIWCSILASLGGLQLMCIVLSGHIINKLKDKSRLASPTSSQKSLSPTQFM